MSRQKLLVELPADAKPKRSAKSFNELSGKEWVQSTCSVWYQRGLGRDHIETKFERQHPAPFAFLMVERLLKFFTKSGDQVLDPFAGVGSTLKACELTGRRGTGVELSEKWFEIAEERLRLEAKGARLQKMLLGDSRDILRGMPSESFDFLVTSPPYWNILNKPADHRVKAERLRESLETRYSDDPLDLANITTYDGFMDGLGDVFKESFRVLKPKAFAAVVVSDFRHKSRYVMYHADVNRMMEGLGFTPKGVIIYVKSAKKLYPYGYPFDFVPNIHHEYILVYRKPDGDPPGS